MQERALPPPARLVAVAFDGAIEILSRLGVGTSAPLLARLGAAGEGVRRWPDTTRALEVGLGPPARAADAGAVQGEVERAARGPALFVIGGELHRAMQIRKRLLLVAGAPQELGAAEVELEVAGRGADGRVPVGEGGAEIAARLVRLGAANPELGVVRVGGDRRAPGGDLGRASPEVAEQVGAPADEDRVGAEAREGGVDDGERALLAIEVAEPRREEIDPLDVVGRIATARSSAATASSSRSRCIKRPARRSWVVRSSGSRAMARSRSASASSCRSCET